MGWWSKRSAAEGAEAAPSTTPAGRARPAGQGGLALIERCFPDAAPVRADVEALLGEDVVLLRLVDELRVGGWPAPRAAIGALREAGTAAAAGAPVSACFALAAWDSVTDGYGAYGLFDALSLLAHQTTALKAAAGAGGAEGAQAGALLCFVHGPALEALAARARPPLVAAHRGLVAFLQTAPVDDPRATAALLAIVDLPIPEADAGWHEHTRAEALRALASRAAAARASAAAAPRPWVSAPVAGREGAFVSGVAASASAPSASAPAPSASASAPSASAASGTPRSGAGNDAQGVKFEHPSDASEAGADASATDADALTEAPPESAEAGLLRALLRELESGVIERVRVAFGLLPGVPGGDLELDARLPALLAWCGDRGDPAVAALRAQALQRWAQRSRAAVHSPAPAAPAGAPLPELPVPQRAAERSAALRAEARAALLALAAGEAPANGPEGLALRVQALDLLSKGLPWAAAELLEAARGALAAPEPELRRAGARALAAVAARG
ncbi:MAG: hypothetical protein JNM72_24870 [Deltaproteobacteria bacterium]|nr:hypothetical protein [Deltaproteobacteria bacterium]